MNQRPLLGGGYRKKKARQKLPRPEWRWLVLEDDLAAEFERPGIISAGDLTKVAFGYPTAEALEAVADAIEFGVVEGVERLETEFEARPLRHRKRLVE